MAVHGGNLDFAVTKYGLTRDKIKDFSGNINPLGLPPKAKEAIINSIDMITTYPDVNYRALRNVIADYISVSSENIVVGNGSTELISLFIKNTAAKAVIVAPAYSEYEREIKLAGGYCRYFPLSEDNSFNADIKSLLNFLTNDTTLLILCNPNNPTGTAICTNDMETIAVECEKRGIKVLIDETYCEFADETKYSSVSLVNKYNNIFVIRGAAKFFSVPGLRLGYGIGSLKEISLLNKIKAPWSVNILAAVAGEHLFTDKDYIKETKAFISFERKKAIEALSLFKSVKVYNSCANFLLFKLIDKRLSSSDIFDMLIKKGIMVRDAADFMFLDDTFIRFCFLSSDDNALLLKELRDLL